MTHEMQTQSSKPFIVESIMIECDVGSAFRFISDPAKLPSWTNAFKEANASEALMNTPAGTIRIGLNTVSSQQDGTIDWYMKMPDGTVGVAYSRVVAVKDKCIYCFILLPPPVPLEALEGTLEEQGIILKQELINLSELLKK